MLNGLKGLLAYSWWLTLAGLLPLVFLLVATFAAVQGEEEDGRRPEDETPVGDRKSLESEGKTAGELRSVLVAKLRVNPPNFQVIPNENRTKEVPEGVRSTLGGQEKLRVGGHLLRLFLEGSGEDWGEAKRRRLDHFVSQAERYRSTAAEVGELIRIATSLRTAVDEWVESKNTFDEVEVEWNTENYSVAQRLSSAEITVVDKLKRRIVSVEVPEGMKLTVELDKTKKALENYKNSSEFQFRVQGWKRTWSDELPKIETDEDDLGDLRASTYRRLTVVITTDESGLSQGKRLEQQLTAQRVELQRLTDRQQELLTDAERLRDVTQAVVKDFPKAPTEVPPTQKLDAAAHDDLTRKLSEVALRVEKVEERNGEWDKKLDKRDSAKRQWIQFQAVDRDAVDLEMTAIARLLKSFPEVDYPTAMIRERLKCHVMQWLRMELFKKKPQFRFPELQEVKLRNSAGWRYGKFEKFAQVAEVVEYKFFELLPGTQTVSEAPRVLKSFQFVAPDAVAQSRFPRRVLTADLIDRYNAALGKAVLQFDELAAWTTFAGVCRDVDQVLVAYLKDVGDDKKRLPSALDFSREVRDSKALVEGWIALDGLFRSRK